MRYPHVLLPSVAPPFCLLVGRSVAPPSRQLDDQLIEADAFQGKVGLQRALFMADGQSFDALMGALTSNSAEQKGPEVAT